MSFLYSIFYIEQATLPVLLVSILYKSSVSLYGVVHCAERRGRGRLRQIPDTCASGAGRERLYPGRLQRNADIVLNKRDKVIAIKESLLQFDKETPFVEVEVAPQKFEKRMIKTSLPDGINIEVVSGLGREEKVKGPDVGIAHIQAVNQKRESG